MQAYQSANDMTCIIDMLYPSTDYTGDFDFDIILSAYNVQIRLYVRTVLR